VDRMAVVDGSNTNTSAYERAYSLLFAKQGFFDTAAEAFWMGMVHDLRIRIGLISAFSDLAT